MQREDFKNRLEAGHAIHAHEIQYPIMQGWDSVKVKADVEIGGTDQLFNILVGRDLQKEEGLPQQVVFLMPLLEGLDGVQKMSKSLGNYVGINEPPGEMFGKLMSISDELMERYYLLLLGKDMPADRHPMDAKKQLAFEIVERYHSTAAAKVALEDFNTRFSRKNLAEADLPTLAAPSIGTDIITAAETAYRALGQSRTRSQIRRLVEQGSVQLGGEKITDPKGTPIFRVGDVLRLDKKRALRLS